MDAPGRKFLAELTKGAAKGIASAATESKLPTPFVNFVAKLCESGEDLIDDFLLTPVMKEKFETKMSGTAVNLKRPDAEPETTELVVVENNEETSHKEETFHW
jgi:hypothetical protein